jgi:hypothetical protein
VVATQGTTATTQAVTVSVNDLNDNNPVFTTPGVAFVAENTPASFVIYDANATDADATFGPVTYSLTGANAAAFNINSVTGEVRLNAPADFEALGPIGLTFGVVATQGISMTIILSSPQA